MRKIILVLAVVSLVSLNGFSQDSKMDHKNMKKTMMSKMEHHPEMKNKMMGMMMDNEGMRNKMHMMMMNDDGMKKMMMNGKSGHAMGSKEGMMNDHPKMKERMMNMMMDNPEMMKKMHAMMNGSHKMGEKMKGKKEHKMEHQH